MLAQFFSHRDKERFMEANIVKVGNSKGVIIPAKILKLLQLEKKVNISVEENKIIITPIDKKTREGWEEMIKSEVEENGPSQRLMPDFFEDEHNEEWSW